MVTLGRAPGSSVYCKRCAPIVINPAEGKAMHHVSPEMQSCIDECLRCYSSCLSSAMSHCLEVGGRHVEPKHMRLMMACAEICRTSAHFMLIGTEHHKHTCRECAEICEECAQSCAELGGMDDCVAACRRCAESCRKMAA
jgi:hypothetical protein